MNDSSPLQPISQETYANKYQLKDKKGNLIDKDMEDTFRRVAKTLAKVEQKDQREYWEQQFFEAMQGGAIPAGRIMSNAGAEEYKPATSTINCTVSTRVDDSMEGILNAVKEAGITLRAGCGIGYCFSTLRPKGAWVNGLGAGTSGPLAFMDIFDAMCKTISSAGGRRGAQMATFSIKHPDVVDFIKAKRQNGRLRQFNVSVLVTDDFMQMVELDKEWTFRFPIYRKEFQELYGDLPTNVEALYTKVEEINKGEEKELIWDMWPGMETGETISTPFGEILCKVYGSMKARDLWDLIMRSTYDYAEPGVIFVDKINAKNNNWWCEDLDASNPCGEQVLPYHGSCLLGSINLVKFVQNPFSSAAQFDWDAYEKVIRVFTRMLDNVVEINGLPLEGQRYEISYKRRHGMGLLGLGSALVMLGMKYGEDDAVCFTKDIMYKMAVVGLEENLALAKEKGPAPIMEDTFTITKKIAKKFPDLFKVGEEVKGKNLWVLSTYFKDLLCKDESEHIMRLLDELEEVGGRFTHHTSIAPTGTIALTFGNNVSGGVEPSFSHSYFRNLTIQGKKSRQQQEVMSYEYWLYRSLIADVSVDALPNVFLGADDIDPKKHLDMQAAAQLYVDASISKTTNVPTAFPFEEFKDLYLYAYKKGLKGTTTFRFNPDTLQGVLVRQEDLDNTLYKFILEDGTIVAVPGSETIMYEGEEHNAAMLYDAIKEGRYHTGY